MPGLEPGIQSPVFDGRVDPPAPLTTAPSPGHDGERNYELLSLRTGVLSGNLIAFLGAGLARIAASLADRNLREFVAFFLAVFAEH
jgi:hypothetical protein